MHLSNLHPKLSVCLLSALLILPMASMGQKISLQLNLERGRSIKYTLPPVIQSNKPAGSISYRSYYNGRYGQTWKPNSLNDPVYLAAGFGLLWMYHFIESPGGKPSQKWHRLLNGLQIGTGLHANYQILGQPLGYPVGEDEYLILNYEDHYGYFSIPLRFVYTPKQYRAIRAFFLLELRQEFFSIGFGILSDDPASPYGSTTSFDELNILEGEIRDKYSYTYFSAGMGIRVFRYNITFGLQYTNRLGPPIPMSRLDSFIIIPLKKQIKRKLWP